MQVLDEKKREKILLAAAELFAVQPFHKVLLSDVAERASVGKGTLYIYFKNKEDLYLSVLYSAFSQLIDCLRCQMDGSMAGPAEDLEVIVRETVQFSYRNPHFFELMRMVPSRGPDELAKWDAKRREFKDMIESVIRRGMTKGIFTDPHPELTARYIPGFVRSALIDGVETVDSETLTTHILGFVKAAILARGDKC